MFAVMHELMAGGILGDVLVLQGATADAEMCGYNSSKNTSILLSCGLLA